MIDRYVNEIVKHLPFSTRKEVKKELTSNIYEALGESASDKEILHFLENMGQPRDIASEYMNKQYLIGPDYYAKYLELMKFVGKIALPIIFVLNFIDSMFNPLFYVRVLNYLSSFATATIATFIGAMMMFTIITIIFAYIERQNKEIDVLPFNFETLKNDTKQDDKKNVVFEGVLTVIGSVIFITLMLFPDIIGYYIQLGTRIEVLEPLFNIEVLRTITPIIIFSLVVSFTLGIVRLYYREENRIILIFDSVSSLLSSAVLILMMNTKNIINPNFLSLMNSKFGSSHDASNIYNLFINNFHYFIYIIILISVITILHNIYKISKTKATD